MHNHSFEVAAFLGKKGRILISYCCFLFGNSLLSGEPLRFEEALPLVLEQAQLTELEEISAQASRARMEAAQALPNPSGFGEHQLLEGSAGDIDQSMFGLSSSIDFLWKRGARIQSARQLGEIAPYQLAERERQIAYQMASIYLTANIMSSQLDALLDIETRLNKAHRISASLVESGEIPPAHRRRITLTIEQLMIELSSLKAEEVKYQSKFTAMTGIESSQPLPAELRDLPYETVASAVAAANANRPDLKALAAIAGWRRSEIDRYGSEGLPEASLDIAYMRDSDDRRGAFLGFSVEIPIFGETSANKRLAQSQSLEAKINLEQLRREIYGEVTAVFNHYHELHQKVRLNDDSNDESYLASELTAFQNGEATVVEYLDAIQVYRDTLFSRIEHRRLRQQAALNLIFQTGGSYPFSYSNTTISDQ